MAVFTVTFLTFDNLVGGNPFWHSAFFLSRLNEATHQLEVVDTWGYYGVPSTGDKNTCFEKLKKFLSMDVDLTGNHGWLTHEEFRYMDLGYGLHGHTFELTEEQFNRLQAECLRRVTEQEAAVRELGLVSPESKKVRHYSGEEYSAYIFAIEQMKAKASGSKPRLRPFSLTVSVEASGLSLEQSRTCKAEALDILTQVVPEEKLAVYKASTFPRFVSSGLEPIMLHSVGPLSIHEKADGRRVYFRKKETGAQLVWTVPPQKIDELPDSGTKALFAVDEEYVAEVKSVVTKLQRLEWLLRNALVPEQYKTYQEELLSRIVAHYRVFSVIMATPKPTYEPSGWIGTAFSLFRIPKNPQQLALKEHIQNAKYLFNALYMAYAEGWTIDLDLRSETAAAVKTEGVSEPLVHASECNPLEALVSYLSAKDQRALCQLLGRTYQPGISHAVSDVRTLGSA